jgi:hypothetical protein
LVSVLVTIILVARLRTTIYHWPGLSRTPITYCIPTKLSAVPTVNSFERLVSVNIEELLRTLGLVLTIFLLTVARHRYQTCFGLILFLF